MKRFTETGKWMDPWYRKLTPCGKLLWQYFCDNCDSTGLCDFDPDLIGNDIGLKVKTGWEKEFTDRLQIIGNGAKIFLTKFIDFQYGELSPECPPHRKVLKLVQDRGLTRSTVGYWYPCPMVVDTHGGGYTVPTGREKEESKEKEEGDAGGDSEPAQTVLEIPIPKLVNKARGTMEEFVEFFTELGLPKSDAESFFYQCEESGWKTKGQPIRDWKLKVRQWKASFYFPSQKTNGFSAAPIRKSKGWQP